MNTLLLVSRSSDQLNLALLEEQKQAPLEFRISYASQIGHIYKGSVLDIHKNLGLAFIDIGEKTPGLLPLSLSFWKKPFFSKGASLVVQVSRDKIKKTLLLEEQLEKEKNVRLTLNLSFSSAFCIFQPNTPGLRFSKMISEKDFSQEVLFKISENLSENEGLILKPLARNITFETLILDLSCLKNLWNQVQEKNKTLKKPGLLLSEKEYLFRYILQNIETLKKIIVDDAALFLSLKTFLENSYLSSFISLESHLPHTKGPLFEAYNLQERWDAQKERIIPFTSGNLILEKTSAFWVFDVNSSSQNSSYKNRTLFQLNIEAGKKILEEIRLKNLSGTIVVDFIPMASSPQRKKLLRFLQEYAQSMSLPLHIHHISPLGLCEMTRPKIETSLLEQFS
ncbi:MAG: ribonuclease E/G [Proteobacteria bacterium]|nr:ribonuclease E/G [Pseudomonadota bacterium]